MWEQRGERAALPLTQPHGLWSGHPARVLGRTEPGALLSPATAGLKAGTGEMHSSDLENKALGFSLFSFLYVHKYPYHGSDICHCLTLTLLWHHLCCLPAPGKPPVQSGNTSKASLPLKQGNTLVLSILFNF